jgi:HPt (histidine-containing phosphotransfer) domain-containing protein
MSYMTLQEFYDATGGGYDTAMRRFRTEERALKFLGLFLKDGSYQLLLDSMASGNVEEAFRAAHSLKGTSQNVSIVNLYDPVFAITEALRAKDMEQAKTLLPTVQQSYETVAGQLRELLQG